MGTDIQMESQVRPSSWKYEIIQESDETRSRIQIITIRHMDNGFLYNCESPPPLISDQLQPAAAGCGKNEFAPPAPSLWSLPKGEKLKKAAIFYPGCATLTSAQAPRRLFSAPC
jgi:hypothetical protein